MKVAGSVSVNDLDASFKQQLEALNLDVDTYLNKIATFVRDEAKQTSEFIDKTGRLRKSIRKRKSKYTDGGYVVSASGRNEDAGYHASLVEFGHELYIAGKPTGQRVPPHPFMRPAVAKSGRFAASILRG